MVSVNRMRLMIHHLPLLAEFLGVKKGITVGSVESFLLSAIFHTFA